MAVPEPAQGTDADRVVSPAARRPGPKARPQVPLRRIVRLFGPHRKRLALLAGLLTVSSMLAMVSPFLLRAILDVALPHGNLGLLSLLAGGMLAVAVGTSVFGVLQTSLSQAVGQDVLHDLRTAVYAHLQRMSLAFFSKTRNGEVQSRIANDIGGMSTTVTMVATTVVSGLTTMLSSLTAMLVLDWRLTLVSVLTLPFFVAISRKVGGERRNLTLERQEQAASMAALVEESLSVNGYLLGRVLDRTGVLVAEFTGRSRALAGLSVSSATAGRWRQALVQIVMAAMPVVIYWAAGLGGGAVSIGTLVAFATLQQGLFAPSLQLLQIGIAVQSSLALFERVFEYLDLPVDVPEPARPVALPHPLGHIRFENVDFGYDDQRVLHRIDLELPPGAHLAVVGATGAGKTTLGYLVPRLYDVTSGRVSVDGVDVRDLSFATLAATVGVVSQDVYLFHGSIADNLRLAKPGADDDEIAAAARAAQIDDLIAGLPEGYETVVGERGYRFSGGERQRLAIARTLVRNPPVLILDEATSALDTGTELAVQQALDRLAAGRTTITIAHRLSTVRAADQIVVLDQGRIAERGTHDELCALGGRYAAMVGEPVR
ncbi:ABC transporter ATP-binding protein [Amycolatopsis sp. NBC_01488]|uniref:ABC transporter ATP-binding protein n=1 Tax=Amycolatopsis sp. NBC_01488 TaxID=2903563 RepID=UPI002E2BFD97|nr:ABC transporter ATP-binding protein [Amycolatopsis sp. NBC_01488]